MTHTKLETPDKGFQQRHSVWHDTSNRKRWTAAIVALIVVIALALGLGLGLGLGRGGGDDDDNGPEPPACTGNCTNYTGAGLAERAPWQIVLSETLKLDDSATVTPNPASDPAVRVYDIDMFLHQNLTVVGDLRAQGMDVICYFSAGSYEPGRPDSWRFHAADLGKELDGWPGEYWLDLTSRNVRRIMRSRIAIAASMNCSGIDPDNVDAYNNENGLGMTEDDSISFVRFLAREAGNYGMMTGLKNAGDIIPHVIDYVQFSVNEQCAQYDECDVFAAFPNASKPVLHIEYPAGTADTAVTAFATSKVADFCSLDGVATEAQSGFNTVLKYMNLSGFVQYCDTEKALTYITDGTA